VRQVDAKVIDSERVGDGLHLLVLDAPAVASAAQPGQFVMVRCAGLTLRRPLSIHLASDVHIALLFRIVGKGTDALSALEPGGEVSITGPLGSGFTLPQLSEKVLLVAGGVGIAPLWFLASRLEPGTDALLVYGMRNARERYIMPSSLGHRIPEARRVARVRMVEVSDDGTCGARGDACVASAPFLQWADRVYVCGPVPMCLAADALSCGRGEKESAGARHLLDAEVSLEARMACGVGACYSCSIQTRAGRRKVCVDGPVFKWSDVVWEELAT
jgi:dihydroorotate dehydrogenase electron transfer subunit